VRLDDASLNLENMSHIVTLHFVGEGAFIILTKVYEKLGPITRTCIYTLKADLSFWRLPSHYYTLGQYERTMGDLNNVSSYHEETMTVIFNRELRNKKRCKRVFL